MSSADEMLKEIVVQMAGAAPRHRAYFLLPP
jgi:hypothetical protein